MNLSVLQKDFRAGLAVFLVAVPLCLGIAIASGADPLSGLIAGMIGGIVIGSLSKSSLSVSGPAAGLVAIVLSAIGSLGWDQFVVALMLAGLIQMVFGVLRLSQYSRYVPHSVVKGMLAAIGMTLIIKQGPVFLGSHGWHLETAQWSIVLIGLLSLGAVLARDKRGKKRLPSLPGSLVGVLVGTISSIIVGRFQHPAIAFVQLPLLTSAAQFAAAFHFPTWATVTHAIANYHVWISALTLALVASIETILSIHAIDQLDPKKPHTPLNRELLAQGAGNLISGFLGGLPITSVIIRSSVNLTAGAQSKLACILHGVFIVIALVFLAPAMNMIPLAALAAILLLTGYNLTKVSHFQNELGHGNIMFISMIVTFVVQLATDLLIGVASGIAVFYVLRFFFPQWIKHHHHHHAGQGSGEKA